MQVIKVKALISRIKSDSDGCLWCSWRSRGADQAVWSSFYCL